MGLDTVMQELSVLLSQKDISDGELNLLCEAFIHSLVSNLHLKCEKNKGWKGRKIFVMVNETFVWCYFIKTESH